jgi:hypothetical protein
MLNTTTLCSSFKEELLNGSHNFNGFTPDTFRIALISSDAINSYGSSFINYGTGSGTPTLHNLGTDEVEGNNGYTTGGLVLTSVTVSLESNIAYVDWTTNPSWGPAATISSTGAIIYNTTQSGKAVAVFDFGGTITSVNGTFTITLPAPGITTALIRIS